MKRASKRILKWLIITVTVFFIIVAIQLTVLAYPSLWFSHHHQIGSLNFYSDAKIDNDLTGVFEDSHRRLASIEIFSDKEMDIFVCHNHTLYSLFARLSLVPPIVPGFNLSIFDNSFVSVERINRMRNNGGYPAYTVFEGNLAHDIAHEVIHDYTQEHLGLIRNLKLPRWKREGYAEYFASAAVMETDSGATLQNRIFTWETSSGLNEQNRQYYKFGLLIQYLSRQAGYGFSDIMADSLSFEIADKQMMSWYRGVNLP